MTEPAPATWDEFQRRVFAVLDAKPGPRCDACGSNQIQPRYRDVVRVLWRCRSCGQECDMVPPPKGAD